MPYPKQINRKQIIEAARQFIRQEGVHPLTLSKLAGRLGVKAPSLYRHVSNKEALLEGVNLLTLQELASRLHEASTQLENDHVRHSLSILQAYRRYAHEQPELYMLAMTTKPGDGRPDEDVLVQMILPFQEIMAEIGGSERSLAALRGAFALVHGYVMLELNQQLQRGGDLDETFEIVAKAYLAGWASID